MNHPPSHGQKLPAFFHGLASYEKSYQPSAISFQPKKKARVDRDNPPVRTAHHSFSQEQPRAAVLY
jgi:hypothetical protein